MISQGTFTDVKPVSIDRVTDLTTWLEVVSQNASDRDWLQKIRDRAADLVTEMSIPSQRDEEWRFTDLSPLLQVQFAPAISVDVSADNLILPETKNSLLVFVNGIYSPRLSSTSGLPPDIFVGNLLGCDHLPQIREYLAQQPGNQEVFTALNTAGLTDAAVVWIPKKCLIETPIHLLFITGTDQTPIINQPRCLVVAEAGSSVTLIEQYSAIAEGCLDAKFSGSYLNNQVTEIWVGANAQVNHTRIQRDASTAFHIGKTAIAQASSSRYTGNMISLGGKISRHNLEIFQTGAGTETILNGLTIIGDDQLADTHSTIALNHPHGITNQLHKSIVNDRAHAVFNGKILVPKPAQLTDAKQLNHNLLLSPKGRVDTKPQLEITADNVKCAHGATVSQLDEEEIFYLQSRGLSAVDASNLLLDAFAAEVINFIPVLSLRKVLARCVACHTEILEICR